MEKLKVHLGDKIVQSGGKLPTVEKLSSKDAAPNLDKLENSGQQVISSEFKGHQQRQTISTELEMAKFENASVESGFKLTAEQKQESSLDESNQYEGLIIEEQSTNQEKESPPQVSSNMTNKN